jgi:hypothetical protein
MSIITINKVGGRGETGRAFDPETDATRQFGSIAEVHEWIDGPGKDPHSNHEWAASQISMNSSTKEGAGMSWDLNAGWDKARVMSYEGWSEGAEKLRTALEKLEDFSPTSSLEDEADGMDLKIGDEGEMFMPDEYFAGEENFMVNIEFKVHKPIIRICCNISASCGVSANDMVARGVVIAATCRKLERLGYGVQIWVADCGKGCDGYSVNLVRIKDSDERMDDKALAFWMGHPAALRRIFFRFIEATPVRVQIGLSYGTPGDFTSDDFDLVSPSAHLDRARSEGWFNKPEAAAKASEEFITKVLNGLTPDEVEAA